MARAEGGRTPHVVIVGAGFAGLECARTLARLGGFRITLIDRNNFHVFQPLLYQVGTGILSASNAAFNLRALLKKFHDIQIKMSTIVRVDVTTRTAYGQAGDQYQGDYLVLAAGSQVNFFGTPGAAEHAFPLYALGDAERLRTRLLSLCEEAEVDRKGLPCGIDVVVVGGGATGVEVAGALADLVHRTPEHLYGKVALRKSTISLVDSGTSVLGPFQDKSKAYANRTLQKRGIRICYNVHVKEILPHAVLLSDGRTIPSKVTIWAGGIQGAALSASLGVKPGKGARLDVDGEFRVAGCQNVFALGDFANCKGKDGAVLPQLASVAKQAGRWCAENIHAAADGEKTRPFRYRDKGIMAMIGRNAAVAEVGASRRIVLGWLAFLAWIAVHVLLLDSARVMVQAVIEWVSDFFGKVNVATILDDGEPKSSEAK